MRPYPRIRKTVKWGGAVVTVLLALAWAASVWFEVSAGGNYSAGVWNGRLNILHDGSPDEASFRLGASPCDWIGMFWGFEYKAVSFRGYTNWFVAIPLWPFIVTTLLLSSLAWRLDHLAHRRARLNLCPKCNYDRAGVAAGAVCPECGASG